MKPLTVHYRRKRKQNTHYQRRLKLLLSHKPRAVVRISNQRIVAQVVAYAPAGDRIIAAVDSFSLRKKGWKGSCKSIPAAYCTGYVLAKRALQAGCRDAILDSGSRVPRERAYAVVKGMADAGMQIPCGEGIFPSPERLEGKHLKNRPLVAELLKNA